MKFYRTTITFEVLHDETMPIHDMSMEAIVHETIDGHASGRTMDTKRERLSKKAMQRALVAQGSDAHFLDMEDCA